MDNNHQDEEAQQAIQHCLQQFVVFVVSIILLATTTILNSTYKKEPEPYHTLILTGEGWVIELLTGHPKRIHCELGVHCYVFVKLISELCAFGHSDSKFVSLEEQLAIFLYSCVTGLTVHHVREQFQRSNEMISQ